MASPTKVYMTRVRLKTRKAARRRKNLLHTRGTTPSKAALFQDDVAEQASGSAKPSSTPQA